MSRQSFKYKRVGSIKTARVLVIWGSLAAGVVAMVLTNNLINEARQTATVEAPQPQMKTEDVLVVTASVNVGQKLDAGLLKWQTWPADGVTGEFITQAATPEAMEEFAGRIVGSAITAGEPLIAAKLHEQKSGGFLSAALPPGLRAYSVKISPETGAGGFILPDDRVDVVMTMKEQATSLTEKVTYSSETVLRNIRVLAIDQSAKDKSTRKGEDPVAIGKTATLALTQRQAEIVALADAKGDVSLTLRSLADADDTNEDVGEALAVSVHRPGTGGMTVTRFAVTAEADQPSKTKLALH